MGDASTDAKRRSEPAPQRQAGIGRLFLSGAVAACIAEATTLPLDTAKVNSQPATLCTCSRTPLRGHRGLHGVMCVYGADKSVHLPPKYRGPFQTVLKIVEEEGVRAPFKGLSPGLHRQVGVSERGVDVSEQVLGARSSSADCWHVCCVLVCAYDV